MAYYRLYRRRRGHIFSVEEVWAEDDAGAVKLAEGKLDGHACDLWCGPRRVTSFDPGVAASAA